MSCRASVTDCYTASSVRDPRQSFRTGHDFVQAMIRNDQIYRLRCRCCTPAQAGCQVYVALRRRSTCTSVPVTTNSTVVARRVLLERRISYELNIFSFITRVVKAVDYSSADDDGQSATISDFSSGHFHDCSYDATSVEQHAEVQELNQPKGLRITEFTATVAGAINSSLGKTGCRQDFRGSLPAGKSSSGHSAAIARTQMILCRDRSQGAKIVKFVYDDD